MTIMVNGFIENHGFQTKQRFASLLRFSKQVEQIHDPQQNTLEVRISLHELKSYFQDSTLLQVHRSYLVNPLKVRQLTRQGRDYTLQLQDETYQILSLPVGRSHIPNIRQVFPLWFR